MQKQFITPIKFWLAGLIAITALFAVSTEVIAKGDKKGEVSKSTVFNDNGKRVCLQIDPKTGCDEVVKCKEFNPFKLGPPSLRRDGKPLKEFLQLPPGFPEPKLAIPGNACAVVIVDDGRSDSYSVCKVMPVVGTVCFTFE